MPPTKIINNPFQTRHDETHLVFRRPWGFRVLTILMTIMLLPLLVVMALMLTGTLVRVDAFLVAVFVPCTLLVAGLTLFMLYLSGPNELQFDLRQRTYRYRRGIPLFSHISEGSTEDFDYFFVRTWERYAYGTRSIDSRIYLVWKTAPKVLGFFPQPELMIGMVPDMDRSYELARGYGRVLGLREEANRLKGNIK